MSPKLPYVKCPDSFSIQIALASVILLLGTVSHATWPHMLLCKSYMNPCDHMNVRAAGYSTVWHKSQAPGK